ncbi:MAG: dihydroorotate dehydrogenase electron transfer subunit [bacterium]|nr:dihydroorotate dehydrogenase electron transfer subunit [bacterium]
MITEVVENCQISSQAFRLTLDCAEIAAKAYPGQFVMIRVNQGRAAPLLRRPFSIHRLWWTCGAGSHSQGQSSPFSQGQPSPGYQDRQQSSPGSRYGQQPSGIQILFRVVGEGTAYLASLAKGAKVDLIGPLGHGFELKEPDYCPVLIAGGIGVAPLLFLADRIKEKNSWPAVATANPSAAEKKSDNPLARPWLFLGGKTAGDILCRDEFQRLGFSLAISTEDGSLGQKGLISEPLAAFLEQMISCGLKPSLFACGPIPLMDRVAEIAWQYRLSGQVSLEQRMACGVGACMGCVVEVVRGKNPPDYKRVCTEGPVFDISGF